MEHFPGRQQGRTAAPRQAAEPVPTRQEPQPYSAPVTHSSPREHSTKKQKPSKLWTILGIVLALALLGALAYSFLNSRTVPGVDGGKYQAVFLTNGQVYFGKLKAIDGSYYKLTSIFYLQANGSNENSDNPQNATKSQDSNVQLIKLGNEVHGPEDEMVIGKDQVLFFENLKSDGKVSSTIADYAKNKK